MTAEQLIRAGDVPTRPWRNGGGLTRELLTWPAGTSAWRLRISVAEVAADGPFSRFPGVERWFAVIAGAGVRLALDGARHELRPGHRPLQFSGAVPVSCSLIDGPTTDLNLMHAGGRARMAWVESGVTFASSMPMRGLFTRVPGAWRAPGANALRVPAQCLLWTDQAVAAPWSFVADDPSLAAPALALEFAP